MEIRQKDVNNHLRNGIDQNAKSNEKCPNYLEIICDLLYEFEDVVLYSLLLISIGLGHKVKEELSKSLLIEKILKSFNKLVESKCSYSIDSDRNFKILSKGTEEFDNSNESGLYTMLGMLACLRINLEYLEMNNPRLEGLIPLLSVLYPEAINAYLTVSKEFEFDGTTSLNYNVSDINQFNSFLNGMELERWNLEEFNMRKSQGSESRYEVSATSGFENLERNTPDSINPI